ncbi:MAG: M14 metallopeptidase family protein [Aquaticitalea sp.]
MKTLLIALICIIACHTNVQAQQITSPKDFLGYELGTQFSRHHQVVDYYKKIASELPNQIKLEQYGETYERRPLYLAIISSEENIENLETIRENNLKNAGVLKGNASSNEVAIVWLSYNVHGTEASSTEASMKTIFELLTQKQEWLKNTVVIIDPCLNPDGRDRYVNWYNETASMPYDTDAQASESNQPWPGGRANHYLFDLNRDWAWASQKETIARLKVYNKWLPQIHVDFHEQGRNEPYYFAPAAEPYHEIITDWQRDFQNQIGANNATYFDANGWLYFTRERFDLLYPSYGDTYPTYLGAIGMTYEQAGQVGLGVLNEEGIVLTLVDRVAHHTVTGLSTVEIASKNAKKLNMEFKNYFDMTSNSNQRSYVLRGHADKIQALKDLLDKHEIKYGHASNGKVSGFNYGTSKVGSMTATSAELVVSTNQSKGKMVKVLFEPQTKLVDSLTYDITAWSLPYAYGLDAIETTKSVATSVIGMTPTLNTKDSNATGYITKWDHLKDAEFLVELLKQNIKVRFSEKSFTTSSDKTYESGSLIITRGDNKTIGNFDAIVVKAANKFKRTLVPASSGFSKLGPDFGSPDVKLVGKPKIAVLSGEYTQSLNYGQIWHFFEQQLHYPMTSINADDFTNINLNNYNVLILPSGNYSRLFDEDNLNKLKNWVSNGGKVIAIDGALNIFADTEGFGLKRNKPLDSSKVKSNLIPYAQRERESAKDFIIGAVFKSQVDTTHPMAFGYDNTYFTLKQGNESYSLLESGYNIVWLGEQPKPTSGFAGSDAVKNLGNSLVLGEEQVGNGSIIYMVDNMLFRSFWENGKLFLINAIFFVNNNSY